MPSTPNLIERNDRPNEQCPCGRTFLYHAVVNDTHLYYWCAECDVNTPPRKERR